MAGPVGVAENAGNTEKAVNAEKNGNSMNYTLCGSLCTVADVLVREVTLPKLEPGDILEFGHCGAYSVTEAPALFLSRQMPAIYAYSKDNGYECLREHIPVAEINLAKKQ